MERHNHQLDHLCCAEKRVFSFREMVTTLETKNETVNCDSSQYLVPRLCSDLYLHPVKSTSSITCAELKDQPHSRAKNTITHPKRKSWIITLPLFFKKKCWKRFLPARKNVSYKMSRAPHNKSLSQRKLNRIEK